MHTLQPKQFKLKKEEVEKLLSKFNISAFQLPKISKKDPSLREEFDIGDVIRIERKLNDEISEYFRVVV